MTCGIYKIYCEVSSRLYIGSAVSIQRRWNEHKRMLLKGTHYNKFLQADWNKCGKTAFSFEVVEETGRENRMVREQVWLDKFFDNQNQCYNMQPFAGSCRGRIVSAETKAKISAKTKGRSNTTAVKTFKVTLMAPNGKLYGPIRNLEAFAKTHQLNPAHLHSVIKGKRFVHKGWRLKGTPSNEELLKMRGTRISKAKIGCKRPDVSLRFAK